MIKYLKNIACGGLAGVSAVLFSSHAIAQSPATPTTQSTETSDGAEERRVLTPFLTLDMIEIVKLTGDPIVQTSGPIKNGEPIITIPVKYVHRLRLKTDFKIDGFIVKAGTLGFRVPNQRHALATLDCFFMDPNRTDVVPLPICYIKTEDGKWAVRGEVKSTIPIEYEYKNPSAWKFPAPEVEIGDHSIGYNIDVTVRVVKWTTKEACVTWSSGGRIVFSKNISRDEKGRVHILLAYKSTRQFKMLTLTPDTTSNNATITDLVNLDIAPDAKLIGD